MYALPGQTLVVRYLGFIELAFEAPEDESMVTIKLKEDVTQLSEVQVTGALGFSRAAKKWVPLPKLWNLKTSTRAGQ